MSQLISKKYATSRHKSNLRNIRGTFAAEGMTISKSTRSNLDRIASGQTSYQQVLTELRSKYWRHPSVTFGDSSPFRGAKAHRQQDQSSPFRGATD